MCNRADTFKMNPVEMSPFCTFSNQKCNSQLHKNINDYFKLQPLLLLHSPSSVLYIKESS